MNKIVATILAVLSLAVRLFAQDGSPNPIRLYRQAHEYRLLSDFMELLKLPNVASDTENIRLNARYIMVEMDKRGLKPRLLEAAEKKVSPVVYGEWMTPGRRRL